MTIYARSVTGHATPFLCSLDHRDNRDTAGVTPTHGSDIASRDFVLDAHDTYVTHAVVKSQLWTDSGHSGQDRVKNPIEKYSVLAGAAKAKANQRITWGYGTVEDFGAALSTSSIRGLCPAIADVGPFRTKFAWLVPVAILFVVSFPPDYGLDSPIVSGSTFLGEIGTYHTYSTFKYGCSNRAEKYERKNIRYACFSKIIRDGGFMIVFMARISALPQHFTTAVFATCGMRITIFTIAAILSMPKQIIPVYIGVVMGEGQSNTQSQRIRGIAVAVGTLITIVVVLYLFRKMNEVKPQVIYERRKTRNKKSQWNYYRRLRRPSVGVGHDASVLASAQAPGFLEHIYAQKYGKTPSAGS
ncbi:hypothetical protein C8J56DRAFT_1112389 [Mycena floridula]|nr:hypothetical protein C8J56DRAFT_1112389 [Mycena floridula]